jgi:aminoglycoside/choline kinase family phosphotransferase
MSIDHESIHQRLAELYLAAFGSRAARVQTMRGDGSDRRIYRLHGDAGNAVGIWGENVPENRAFLGFTRAFASHDLAVPRIFAVGADERCYLEEDLGDTLLYDWQAARREGDDLPAEVFEMYARVLRELLRFQIDAAESVDYALCYQYAEFAGDAIRFDLRYFREMFLDQLFPEYDATAYERDCDTLVARLLGTERRFFLYRDFQSRNIMIKDDVLRFIDYQSGRRGALQYDVASLLYDAKARLPEASRRALLGTYLDGLETRDAIGRDAFLRDFDAWALLRILQALGAFGNLGYRKKKPGFLDAIPPALGNFALLTARDPLATALPALANLAQQACAHATDPGFPLV